MHTLQKYFTAPQSTTPTPVSVNDKTDNLLPEAEAPLPKKETLEIILPPFLTKKIEAQKFKFIKPKGKHTMSSNASPLINSILEKLQVSPYSHTYMIPTDHVPLVQEFRSKQKCKDTAIQCLQKSYEFAQSCITPGNKHCVALDTADYYAQVINHCFTPFIDSLKIYCRKVNKDTVYQQLRSLLDQCKNKLQLVFEKELRDSSDYYSMYRFDYFVDQIEIEEQDYRINDKGLLRLLDTLAAHNIDYTFTGCLEAIGEMNLDLQRNLTTFFNAAYNEYTSLVSEIEFLVNVLGTELPEIKYGETLNDYIMRITPAE